MKLVLFTSIICVILGLGVIVGAGIAYPFINSALSNLESTALLSLNRAENALSSAQQAINSTQVTLLYLSSATNVSLPALSSSGRLTGDIANNLTSIGSTITGVGQTLGNISVAGVSPFSGVGSAISSVGQPITDAANSLHTVSSGIGSIQQQAADIPNRLNTITIQIGNVNSTLGELRSSVIDAQNSLPGYFNQIGLVVILAIAGVMGLGVIFLLIGISLFSLRRKTIELNHTIYKFYNKYSV